MTTRGSLLLAACVYLLFVVYGSLVPLNYRPLPWGEAWQHFSEIRFLQLGIASRADWVANLLLFVPLTYLWAGVLWRRGARGWNAASYLALALLGALLSLGIEFTQVFFPGRTVSINDIAAEMLGGLIGVGLWAWTGPALLQWLHRQGGERGSKAWTERVLQVYLFCFFAYSLLPLDLTISPVELYRKWEAGSIQLLPFGTGYDTLADAVYDLGADMLLWLPVAVLWRMSGWHTTTAVVVRVLLVAMLLELLQLFVWSRVTSTTDLLTAMLGGWVGALIGSRLGKPRSPQALRRDPGAPLLWAGAALLAWVAAVLVVFWYPFEIRTDRAFVVERLQLFLRVPFASYYGGTEFRAITELFRKMLAFMPGGVLLAWWVLRAPAGALRGAAGLAAGLALAGLAMTIELGQVVLPGKYPDSTDWFLETLGGFVGAGVAWVWLRRRGAEAAPRPLRPETGPRRHAGGRKPAAGR